MIFNSTKIYPKKINCGDIVGIIAPSSPINLPEKTIQAGYDFLLKKGLNILESENLRKKENYTAGSIKERVDDIHAFFKNTDVKCIMTFWGGFNSNQLLDYLDYNLIKKNPKILIGYSDVTALTLAITTKTGLITFSGPGLISFTKPKPIDYTWKYFSKLCIEPEEKLFITQSDVFADDLYFLKKNNNNRIIKKNLGLKVLKEGLARGVIVAGNLQTILLLVGTPYFPKINNTILFLEEAEDADICTVDRLLTQCRQMGIFNKVNGVIFGKFMSKTGFNDLNLKKLLKRIFDEINIPVMYDANFGHTDPIFTIPNGGYCYLNTEKREIIFDRAIL